MALTFFTRCEVDPLDGTHDFSAADNDGTFASLAALATGSVRIGTNGLECPTSNDFYSFDPATIMPITEGAAAFSLRIDGTWTDNVWVFAAYNGATNYISVVTSGGDELTLNHRVAAGTNLSISTSGAALTAGNWYGVVIRWDTVNNLLQLAVYDASNVIIGSPVQSTDAMDAQASFANLEFGNTPIGSAVDLSMDNIFIADDYDELLQNFLTITSYTEYGVAGAANAVPTILSNYTNMGVMA